MIDPYLEGIMAKIDEEDAAMTDNIPEDVLAKALTLAQMAAGYFDNSDDEEFIGNFTKDIARAIMAERMNERKACTEIAFEFGRDAAEQVQEDRKSLGNDYDMNSYGSGYDSGQETAANRIAQDIRSRSGS